jgi:hypothetical protein
LNSVPHTCWTGLLYHFNHSASPNFFF